MTFSLELVKIWYTFFKHIVLYHFQVDSSSRIQVLIALLFNVKICPGIFMTLSNMTCKKH